MGLTPTEVQLMVSVLNFYSTFSLPTLRDAQGVLETDDYAGYNQVAKEAELIHVKCWPHVLRRFKKALMNYPEAESSLDLIGDLYQKRCRIPRIGRADRRKP